MKILVTFALENEFAPWRARHDFRSGRWGEADAQFAEIGGADVGVVLTGVGPRAAGVRVSEVIWGESGSISFCISSGLAGALKDGRAVGEILVAKGARSESVHADVGSDVVECSGALVSFAGECGAAVVDRFYTSERAIGASKEKRYLSEFADAVEMESFEILKEALAFGIPAVAIRAISDLADENLPLDMNEVFTDEGKLSVARVLGQVALHPGAVPGLVKLGQRSKTAAESLAKFLDRYVATVAARTGALRASGAA